jgi:hypothetical protein
MQMGQDRRVDVLRRVPQRCELGGERVRFSDVEPGEAIVEVPREPTGEYESSVTEARSCPVSNRMSPWNAR